MIFRLPMGLFLNGPKSEFLAFRFSPISQCHPVASLGGLSRYVPTKLQTQPNYAGTLNDDACVHDDRSVLVDDQWIDVDLLDCRMCRDEL